MAQSAAESGERGFCVWGTFVVCEWPANRAGNLHKMVGSRTLANYDHTWALSYPVNGSASA